MSATSDFVLKHIPAWKRLGLELKNSGTPLKRPEISFSSQLLIPKRRESYIASGSAKSPPPAKKSKMSGQSQTADETVVFDESEALSSAFNQDQKLAKTPITTSAPKRKCVSFTPETKSKDGESVKQIYKTWLASQAASDPSFNPLTLAPALKSITPETLIPSPDRKSPPPTLSSALVPGKEKKRKQKKNTSITPSKGHISSRTSEEPGYLTYLNTYHTAPHNWKFSTQHQTRLLRNLFRLDRVPSTCDPALLHYLRGLKGSSSRSCAHDQALAICEVDAEWIDSDEGMDGIRGETDDQNKARKKRDYEAAVDRMKAMLKTKEDEKQEEIWALSGEREEWEMKLRQRKRAEVVLWALGMEKERTLIRKPEEQSRGSAWKIGVPKKTVFEIYGVEQHDEPSRVNSIADRNDNVLDRLDKRPAGKKIRKRKRRTGVPDDESSSSEDSSSSSDTQVEEKPTQRIKMKKTTARQVSSSSSSSSDSDSTSEASDTSTQKQ